MTLRCPVCRTRRASFASLVAHEERTAHRAPCRCGAYPFPHRPGSAFCDAAPYPRLSRAIRAGASEEERIDAFIDDALFGAHRPVANPKEIPF